MNKRVLSYKCLLSYIVFGALAVTLMVRVSEGRACNLNDYRGKTSSEKICLFTGATLDSDVFNGSVSAQNAVYTWIDAINSECSGLVSYRYMCDFGYSKVTALSNGGSVCTSGGFGCQINIDTSYTHGGLMLRVAESTVSIISRSALQTNLDPSFDWYEGSGDFEQDGSLDPLRFAVDAEGILVHEMGHAFGYQGDQGDNNHHVNCSLAAEFNAPTMAPGAHWGFQEPPAPKGSSAMRSLEFLDKDWLQRDFCPDTLVALGLGVVQIVDHCEELEVAFTGVLPSGATLTVRQAAEVVATKTLEAEDASGIASLRPRAGKALARGKPTTVAISSADGATEVIRESVPVVSLCSELNVSLRALRGQGDEGVRFVLDAVAGGVGTDPRITIFSASGREVVSVIVPAGARDVVWRLTDSAGRKVANGVYFARLTGIGRPVSKKFLVLE